MFTQTDLITVDGEGNTRACVCVCMYISGQFFKVSSV